MNNKARNSANPIRASLEFIEIPTIIRAAKIVTAPKSTFSFLTFMGRPTLFVSFLFYLVNV